MARVLVVLCFFLGYSYHTSHAATVDMIQFTPDGTDLSYCTTDASPFAKQCMKKYRQCYYRYMRYKGELDGYTDEQYEEMLATASSDCKIDDICFTENQAFDRMSQCMEREAMLTGTSSKRRRRRKRAVTTELNLWDPPDILYSYHTGCGFTSEEMTRIRRALDIYENSTCIRFSETTLTTFNGIRFQCPANSGCSSSIGDTDVDPQGLNLARPNCVQNGVIIHELLHALGVYHEQSRPDRDQFVIIYIGNVTVGREHNFNLEEAFTEFSPYDYGSVMHYSKLAFSRTGTLSNLTLEPRQIEFYTTLGQSGSFSYWDLRELNEFYCNDTCASSSLSCQNHGYPNPSHCNACICPPTHNSADKECRDMSVNDDPQNVCVVGEGQNRTLKPGESTEVQLLDHALGDFSCAWRVIGEEGSSIVVNTIGSFGTTSASGPDPFCILQWLQLFDEIALRDGFEETQRYCLATGPSNVLLDTTSIIILFTSFKFDLAELSVGGFQLNVSLVDNDECASNPCENDGTCDNQANMFECICEAGYTGDTCQSLVTTTTTADETTTTTADETTTTTPGETTTTTLGETATTTADETTTTTADETTTTTADETTTTTPEETTTTTPGETTTTTPEETTTTTPDETTTTTPDETTTTTPEETTTTTPGETTTTTAGETTTTTAGETTTTTLGETTTTTADETTTTTADETTTTTADETTTTTPEETTTTTPGETTTTTPEETTTTTLGETTTTTAAETTTTTLGETTTTTPEESTTTTPRITTTSTADETTTTTPGETTTTTPEETTTTTPRATTTSTADETTTTAAEATTTTTTENTTIATTSQPTTTETVEVRLFLLFSYPNPPTPDFFTDFFQLWHMSLQDLFRPFCPNATCLGAFACTEFVVQLFEEELSMNNVEARYVDRIQATLTCTLSTPGTNSSVPLPAGIIRDFILTNFDDLTQELATCCSAGLIPACCSVDISNNITTGPINGTVDIPIGLETTTRRPITITPVAPAPTRRSYLTEIWVSVSGILLVVTILVVLMSLTTGRRVQRFMFRGAFRQDKINKRGRGPGLVNVQPVYVTAQPQVHVPFSNPTMALRRSNNMFQPRLPGNPTTTYYCV